MESQQLKGNVYVHSGTFAEFIQYQKQNRDYNCVCIVDDTSLRGRSSGQVVRVGTYRDKWNHQAIEESIMMQEHIWSLEDAPSVESDDNNKDIMDYGV